MTAITRDETDTKGRYVLIQGDAEAQLTYVISSPRLRIADRTGVRNAFRGTGAGRKLVERLVADARAKG